MGVSGAMPPLSVDCRVLAAESLGPPAQRAGRAWQWFCPFHADRATPSFTVYAHGYICFGCGVRGGARGLAMALGRGGNAPRERLGWEVSQRVAQPGAGRASWRAAAWQRVAWRLIGEAAACLLAPQGAEGRAYLAGRGLGLVAWEAWRLGYAPQVRRWRRIDAAWQAEDLGPAITLPWFAGRVVKALQYRLIGHPSLRYWQRAGGERTLCGVHLLAGRPALVVCEGELNAVSLWQAVGDRADVVSFGPQSNLAHAAPYLRRLAARYPFVVAWADEAGVARAALGATARHGIALRSPGGRDASDLLQEGVLGELMGMVLDKG